jgi:hypothetical protein
VHYAKIIFKYYFLFGNCQSRINQEPTSTQTANQSRATATVKKSPLNNSKIPKLCVPIIAGHKPKKLWSPSMARQTVMYKETDLFIKSSNRNYKILL